MRRGKLIDQQMERFCAIVVSHNPANSFRKNVALLSQFAELVLLFDNGSVGERREAVNACRDLPNVMVLPSEHNIGLGAALNSGLCLALELGFEWIGTFDQDSTITDGYFEQVFEAYYACRCRERVAAVSPVYLDQISGVKTSFCDGKSEASHCLVKTSRTSGTLYRSKVFEAIGLFREDFFIDCIDVEYCLRSRRAGFILLEASKAILLHNLGQTSRHRLRFARRTVSTTNHSCRRRYYMSRNRIVVYKRYLTFDPRWVASDAFGSLKQTIKVAMFEDGRACKVLATIRGTIDGFRGKLGELSHVSASKPAP